MTAWKLAPAALIASAALVGLAADQAAASYTAQVQAGTLKLTGNAASDKLVLRLQPGVPNMLEADVGADGTADLSFDRTTFTAIDVAAGGGADEVRIDPNTGLFSDEAVTIDGGGGADKLTGGFGAETLLGGSGNDVVTGSRGDDVARLGSGADSFAWNPGDGSDIVEGEAGTDVLDFNGSAASESIDVSANGPRVRFFRNVASITTDLDDVERVAFDAAGGADTIVVNDVTGTDLETAEIDLSAVGGGADAQPDTVVVNGTAEADSFDVGGAAGDILVDGPSANVQVAGSEAALDNVNVATLGGADTITGGVGIPGPAEVNVDGGDGADTATYTAPDPPDTITVVPTGSEVWTSAPAAGAFDTPPRSRTSPCRGSAARTRSPSPAAALAGPADARRRPGRRHAPRERRRRRPARRQRQRRRRRQPGRGPGAAGRRSGSLPVGSGRRQRHRRGRGRHDVLDFNASNAGETVDLSANGGRVLLHRNIGAVTIDLDDVEGVGVRALGGADTIAVGDLTGTDLDTAEHRPERVCRRRRRPARQRGRRRHRRGRTSCGSRGPTRSRSCAAWRPRRGSSAPSRPATRCGSRRSAATTASPSRTCST